MPNDVSPEQLEIAKEGVLFRLLNNGMHPVDVRNGVLEREDLNVITHEFPWDLGRRTQSVDMTIQEFKLEELSDGR